MWHKLTPEDKYYWYTNPLEASVKNADVFYNLEQQVNTFMQYYD